MLVTDIVVFYLVLRGLDTVEDDMTAFEDIQVKHIPKLGLQFLGFAFAGYALVACE